MTVPNFFCVGLPNVEELDAEVGPIFRKRLIEQKAAFLYLFLALTHKNIAPTAGWLHKACSIL